MRSKGYGRIVNITSGALAGFTWLAAYGTSKGGLLSLTRSLAAEGAETRHQGQRSEPGRLHAYGGSATGSDIADVPACERELAA